jgi:hypothetical protein
LDYQEVAYEGLIWRVGNGRSINVWGDRWMPSPSSYAIQAHIQLLNENSKVISLIDEGTHWWNHSRINELFSAEEATFIYNILVCSTRQQDNLIWLGKKNGEFTVKSTYHLAKSSLEESRGSSSNLATFGRRYGE